MISNQRNLPRYNGHRMVRSIKFEKSTSTYLFKTGVSPTFSQNVRKHFFVVEIFLTQKKNVPIIFDRGVKRYLALSEMISSYFVDKTLPNSLVLVT